MNNRSALWLTLPLALSGCASSGKVVPIACPKPAKPPAEVMKTPNFEQKVRQLLFDSEPKPTSGSDPVNP
jgi:hypothetical protein